MSTIVSISAARLYRFFHPEVPGVEFRIIRELDSTFKYTIQQRPGGEWVSLYEDGWGCIRGRTLLTDTHRCWAGTFIGARYKLWREQHALLKPKPAPRQIRVVWP